MEEPTYAEIMTAFCDAVDANQDCEITLDSIKRAQLIEFGENCDSNESSFSAFLQGFGQIVEGWTCPSVAAAKAAIKYLWGLLF